MLDGNGLLHPFGLGLASHVGVILDIPCIGVAKSMLCGKLKNNTIQLNNKKIGYVLYSAKRAKKPVYVSPGHKVSFDTSVNIVKHFCTYRLPDPLRHAHNLAKTSLG